MTNPRALVTGGGGFLGLYIVEQLLGDGFEVRSLSRNSYECLRTLNVEHVAGDLRDATAVERACEGVDVVFHTAAVPGIWGSRQMFFDINTVGTENVIAACRKHLVTKLVYTSSPSVVFGGENHVNANETLPYPKTWLAHYPASKAAAEQQVLAASDDSLATCALRPHLIWGPRDTQLVPRLIRRAKAGRLRIIGDGSNEISMAYVENVAAAHLQAAQALATDSPVAGQAYFINEPEPIGCWEWINTLLARACLPPVQKRISTKAAYRIGAILEFVYSTLRLSSEPPMTRFLASQLSTSHSYEIGKAQRDFEYQPIFSVEEGLAKLEPELKKIASCSV